jgi:heat-inducible transcriptional repressor
MVLSDRKQRVLRAIVDDYVATAQPVGSLTLSRKYRLGVSPATLRNEMAGLEDLGYLEQPHTSAGRIPSDRGYRLYVDALMQRMPLVEPQVRSIRNLYEARIREIEDLIRETARTLSEHTKCLAMIFGPKLTRTAFRTLRMLPLSEDSALLVLVTDAGFVESAVIGIPRGMQPEHLLRFAALVNSGLQGKTLGEVADGLLAALRHELSEFRELVEQAFDVLSSGLEQEEGRSFHIVGATNILGQPEFRDAAKVRDILRAVESGAGLETLTDPSGDHGVVVTIGHENRHPAMHECSLVTATYRLGARTVGTLGVLGPTRMDYARVLAVVHSVTHYLSGALSRSVQVLR